MNYDPVRLPDDKDWLLRPVMRDKLCYESLLDGSVDLNDIADLNDALDVVDENEFRANETMRRH